MMNCGGGGGERSPLLRQHRHSMAIRLSASNGDGLVVVAHVVASSECWPAALRLPRFSPNNCPTRCKFFSDFKNIK
jgi:hypothetical protein